MLDYELCRAFAHAVLTATSVLAVQQLGDTPSCAHGAIGLHFIVGVVGFFGSLVLKFTDSNLGITLMNWYRFFSNLATVFVLPLMATQLYINSGFQFEYCLIHVGSAIIPFVYDSISDRDRGMRDAVLAGNCASLCYLGFVKTNVFAYAMAACFAFNYFVVRTKSQISEFQATDVYVCLLGLLNQLFMLAY